MLLTGRTLLATRNTPTSFAAKRSSIKPGLVQTVTMSGFGQPRLRRRPIVNRFATDSHASSDSHMLGESIGSLICQWTRHCGHRRIAK